MDSGSVGEESMANVYDRGDVWELSIYPNIKSVEVMDEMETKGYKATLGYDPEIDLHVVATVLYSKDRYSVDDVVSKIQELHDCDRCDTLNKERLHLDSIHVPSNITQTTAPVPVHVPVPQPVTQAAPPTQQGAPDVKNLFGQVIMDAYLTDPGKYFLGMMLDDPILMESAYPTDKRDVGGFMSDMIDFMSGEMDFMRTPDEARDFLSVMQSKEENSKSGAKDTTKKKAPIALNNIVIY